jgi:hypothetical protein
MTKPKYPSKDPLHIRKTAVKYKYGITWDELEVLHQKAGEACEICGLPIKLVGEHKRETVHVDHCHSSGKVRGVLCLKCNVGIGAFLESRLHLQKAIEYLDKHDLNSRSD